MKRIFSFFVFFTFVFLSIFTFVHAQSGDEISGVMGEIGTISNNRFTDEQLKAEYLNALSLKFCDKGLSMEKLTEKASFFASIGKKQPLCVVFMNEGGENVKVSYRYLSAGFSDGSPYCEVNLTGSFYKLFDFPTKTIDLPAHSYLVQRDEMFVPIDFASGSYNGCIAYEMLKEAKSGPVPMFSISTRHVSYLDVFVGGEADIVSQASLANFDSDSLTNNKKIGAHIDENGDMIISVSLKNDGNITQNIILSGKISNLLGFDKPIVFPNQTLLPYQTTELSVNIGSIPAYKGLFDIKLKGSYTPSYSFDTSALSPKLLESGSLAASAMIFMFSNIFYRIGGIALLIVLLLLFALYRLIKLVFKRHESSAI